LRLLMELLTGTMLASLSHDRLSRYSKASAKSRNKTKICYFHCLPFLPIFCYRNRAGVMVKIYVQLQWHGYALYTWVAWFDNAYQFLLNISISCFVVVLMSLRGGFPCDN